MMNRNLDAPKFVKRDRRSSPKSTYVILDDFFSGNNDNTSDELKKRSRRSPFAQTFSSRSLPQQRLLNDRKKKVRFARRNKAYPASSTTFQCHWTPADRHCMIREQSHEAKTIVEQERSWGHLPDLFQQLHIESYGSWGPVKADPILTHLYRHEPERLLGIERLHAPWLRSRDSWSADAAAKFALRLGLSLAEALNDDTSSNEEDDPMIIETWGESFFLPNDPMLNLNSNCPTGRWV
jgi:hypothetical protein